MSEDTTHYQSYHDKDDYQTQHQKRYNETHNNSIPASSEYTIGIPIDPPVNDEAADAYTGSSARNKFATQNLMATHVHTHRPPASHHIKKSPENTFYKNQKHLCHNPAFAATYPPHHPSEFPQHPEDKMSLPEFIHKTLNYVFAQICVTAAVTTAMYVHKNEIKNYVAQHYGLVWLPIILTFGSLLTMFCCQKKESEQLKKIMFCVFTLACSAMIGISALQYAPEVILNATLSMFVIVGFINIYAYNTAKKGEDFSTMGPSLMGFLLIVITLGIVNIFIKSSMLQLCIAAVSVIIFTALLLFDLNRLYNGRELDDYEEPDPLLSAINIYLDIINIFLNLLQIFGGTSGGD